MSGEVMPRNCAEVMLGKGCGGGTCRSGMVGWPARHRPRHRPSSSSSTSSSVIVHVIVRHRSSSYIVGEAVLIILGVYDKTR